MDHILPFPRLAPPWSDRVEDDEVQLIAGMRVTTPARTALDLACRYPIGKAVAAIDALARATRLKMADVESLAERYRGRRDIRRARIGSPCSQRSRSSASARALA